MTERSTSAIKLENATSEAPKSLDIDWKITKQSIQEEQGYRIVYID